MNSIHSLINELGAEIDDSARDNARLILNNLYLNGYSDIWVCIALERILSKGEFNQWKYLLSYDNFIVENDFLENEFLNVPLKTKLHDLSLSLEYNREISISNEEAEYITETLLYPSEDKSFIYDDFKDDIEYWYMKYAFTGGINYHLKYLFHGTNVSGFCDSGL